MISGITYNHQLKIAAVGTSPWPKLGPEVWFDDYVVVCANSFNFKAKYIIDLGLGHDDLEYFSTQSIIDSDVFQKIASENLSQYRLLPYKPITVPASMSQKRFIVNPKSFAQFENKRIFRELFNEKIPIPKYRMVASTALLSRSADDVYNEFFKVLGEKFVIQDDIRSGGRGTFIVDSIEATERALTLLAKERPGKTCIISQFIAGVERSIQVFVSKEQIVLGPLQQQLVRNPDLLNPDKRGGVFFCGGKLVWDASADIGNQVRKIVDVIGKELQSSGYRGIFGIDFLIDETGMVYALEINARTTGLLPLLNEQRTDIPLYLLHILELAGEEYVVETAPTLNEVTSGPKSFVILFNKDNYDTLFDGAITTGNYKIVGETFHKINDDPRWHPDADILLQLFCSSDFPALPNQKVCNIFLKGIGFTEDGSLTPETRRIVGLLKKFLQRNTVRRHTVT